MASQTHTLKILIEAQDRARKALGGLGDVLNKGVAVGAAAATGAVIGLSAALAESVMLASEQERVEAQLAQTLDSTRFAAGLTADELKNMASELQNMSTFGDEAIIGAESLLLTFTNIGRDVFPNALETVLDMSTALGQDLKTSAIQLGKALNDPVEGVSALRRVGVSLTEDQENLIKKLVESGDVMGAQKVILGELSTEFGGSAAAAADTFGGRVQQLKNLIGDLGEQVGFALLPTLTDLAEAALPKVQGAIEKAQEVLPTFSDALQEALAGDTQLAIQDLQKGLLQLGFSPEQVEDISNSAITIGESLGRIGEALGQIDAGDIETIFGAITSVVEGTAKAVEKLAEAARILQEEGLWSMLTSEELSPGASPLEQAFFGGSAQEWLRGNEQGRGEWTFAGMQWPFGGGQQGSPPAPGEQPATSVTIEPQTISLTLDGEKMTDAVTERVFQRIRAGQAVGGHAPL